MRGDHTANLLELVAGFEVGWKEGAWHPGPGVGHPDVPAGDIPGADSCPLLGDERAGCAQQRWQAYTYIFNVYIYVCAVGIYLVCVNISASLLGDVCCLARSNA